MSMPALPARILLAFLLSNAVLPVGAVQAEDRLRPRVETNFRAGTERSIAMTEIWMPLAQQDGGIVYGDLRFSADNGQNHEGNAGLGYRQLDGDFIYGAHAWFDRRETENGSNFHQIALGLEMLGRDYDARVNGYIPLSGAQRHVTPNAGRSNPYMAGTGVYADAPGLILEEPQPGLDAELGFKIPEFTTAIDTMRFYGGGYTFQGDRTKDIYGWRTRLTTDINSAVQLGVRFQSDNVRGSQSFLEATLRFPFSAKQTYREKGLSARLDESPERDIDIVTAAAVLDDGLAKPVVNAGTGEAQRVLHVDNTAVPGGDGSADRPFSTLAGAQAALQDNDIVYIHRGDGTTTGQDTGFDIDKENVLVIGSGVDFVYDADRFGQVSGRDLSGLVIARATAAPSITNTEAPTGFPDGNGFYVTADKAEIAGVSIENTTRNGIYAYHDNGGNFESFTVRDLTVSGNVHYGAIFQADDPGSTLTNLTIRNVTANGNAFSGIISLAQGGGSISNADISNITANGNTQYGIQLLSTGAGSALTNYSINNVVANNNLSNGIYMYAASGGRIDGVDMAGLTTNNNTLYGVRLASSGANSHINDISMDDLVSDANGNFGLYVGVGANGEISNVDTSDIAISNSGLAGIYVYGGGDGKINDLRMSGITSTLNADYGIYINATGANTEITATLENSVITANQKSGVYIDDDVSSPFIVDLGGGSLGGAGGNSFYGNRLSAPASWGDVHVDADGGQVSAQSNWWGQAGGPVAGQIKSDAAPHHGTVDSTSPLAADPAL